MASGALACERMREERADPPTTTSAPAVSDAPAPLRERYDLGAAFVGGNPRGLAEVLQGAAAAAYLTELAAHSNLSTSELSPQTFSPEGTFLLEQGTWIVRSGDRMLGSRYHLRWRRVDQGWKVVLLRWSLFR